MKIKRKTCNETWSYRKEGKMKSSCEQCKRHEVCPYGQEEFINKVEDGIEEIIDQYDSIKIRPNVELLIAVCDEFKEG